MNVTITIVQTRPHPPATFRWRSLSVRESCNLPAAIVFSPELKSIDCRWWGWAGLYEG